VLTIVGEYISRIKKYLFEYLNEVEKDFGSLMFCVLKKWLPKI
jgi:hypothetical protein